MLTRLAFFSLLIFSKVSYSQSEIDKIVFDITKFKLEASLIMSKLGIKQRINFSMDDTLKLFIDTSLSVFNAKFGTLKEKGVISPDDLRFRYYLTPVIKVSPLMNLVITKSRDTTSLARLKAYSIIIHEIVHYLQETWDNESYFVLQSKEDEKLYISQPSEKEAYAAGSYFYLKINHKMVLNKIMLSSVSVQKKFEMLINAYREKVYPWRGKLFD